MSVTQKLEPVFCPPSNGFLLGRVKAFGFAKRHAYIEPQLISLNRDVFFKVPPQLEMLIGDFIWFKFSQGGKHRLSAVEIIPVEQRFKIKENGEKFTQFQSCVSTPDDQSPQSELEGPPLLIQNGEQQHATTPTSSVISQQSTYDGFSMPATSYFNSTIPLMRGGGSSPHPPLQVGYQYITTSPFNNMPEATYEMWSTPPMQSEQFPTHHLQQNLPPMCNGGRIGIYGAPPPPAYPPPPTTIPYLVTPVIMSAAAPTAAFNRHDPPPSAASCLTDHGNNSTVAWNRSALAADTPSPDISVCHNIFDSAEYPPLGGQIAITNNESPTTTGIGYTSPNKVENCTVFSKFNDSGTTAGTGGSSVHRRAASHQSLDSAPLKNVNKQHEINGTTANSKNRKHGQGRKNLRNNNTNEVYNRTNDKNHQGQRNNKRTVGGNNRNNRNGRGEKKGGEGGGEVTPPALMSIDPGNVVIQSTA